MQSSHILVIPSYHEGYGIAYLEGMGFGLPAIATTAGGTREIITHGVNGFLVPQENAFRISEDISRMINDRQLLIKMSKAALERFHQHPSWENSMSRIRPFLERNVNQEDN
jgi:glycosyltransferase involved in cell wall biosynthesis